MTSITLLMLLLNEGTEVWRPVAAERLDDGTCRITGPIPDDEEWAFAPGSIVAARLRVFGYDEGHLVAVSLT